MRRGFMHGSVWLLAMGVAVAVSWWGVRSVMSGPLGDAPRAIVLGGSQDPAPAPSDGESSGPPPPVSSPPPSPGAGGHSPPAPSGTPQTRPPGGDTPPASPPRTPAGGGRPVPDTTPPPDRPTGKVEPVSVPGGRVVFEMGESSASLVSATPASGWQMQTWHQSTYIRVTFTKGSQEISVFCVWHDQAPRIQIEGL
ncbi:hypothetical protein [Streptomyces sp. NPDC051183]|uniref:hypothetical protein n=1 Tax=unclassified Streptomyces TaxID=2593676 RepID=UPI0034255DF2